MVLIPIQTVAKGASVTSRTLLRRDSATETAAYSRIGRFYYMGTNTEYLSLKEYADREGKSLYAVQKRAYRDALKGAVKIGRQWCVPISLCKNVDET